MAPKSAQTTIGILALQGDFAAHTAIYNAIGGVVTRLVRTPQDLAAVDSLTLPGGESTTIIKLMDRFQLTEPLRIRLAAGMPAFGTCAGMILLSKSIEGMPEQPTLGALNVVVQRNAFGRQLDSFEADLKVDLPGGNSQAVRAVFIRAPYVVSAGDGVAVLSHFEDRIVAVQQGSILAIAFHPEISADARLHEYFIELTKNSTELR